MIEILCILAIIWWVVFSVSIVTDTEDWMDYFNISFAVGIVGFCLYFVCILLFGN